MKPKLTYEVEDSGSEWIEKVVEVIQMAQEALRQSKEIREVLRSDNTPHNKLEDIKQIMGKK